MLRNGQYVSTRRYLRPTTWTPQDIVCEDVPANCKADGGQLEYFMLSKHQLIDRE